MQRFTPTIEALLCPDVDASLDEAPKKTAFWNAFKARPLVGGASAVLSLLGRRRAAGIAATIAGLAAWDALAGSLPALSDWPAVAIVACALIPATFLLLWLVLPLRAERPLVVAAVPVCALAAVGLQLAGSPEAAGFFKLGATAALGFWLLVFFERLSWVVLVACIVPWVDAYSVWRGPTHEIVKHRAHVFEALSIPFPLPGGAVANLGLPDLLFFALFLGRPPASACAPAGHGSVSPPRSGSRSR